MRFSTIILILLLGGFGSGVVGFNLTSPTEDKLSRKLDLQRVLNMRWPNKTMNIDSSILKPKHQKFIEQTADYLNSVSCFNFRTHFPKKTTPLALIVNKNRKACYARLGYKRKIQRINLPPICFQNTGIVIHELLHSTGIDHEQSRIDRNEFVNIQLDNIMDSKRNNYQKSKGHYGFLMTMGLPYDYNSLMHYPATGSSFAKNKHIPVMKVLKDPGTTSWILGQGLSANRKDIAQLNRLYDCQGYYVGDDIPGAVPYKVWKTKYMTPSQE